MTLVALDLVARALVLLGVAWTAALVFHRRSASLRAMIWTIALGALLLLPTVSWLAPAWRVPVWRATVAPGVRAPLDATTHSLALPRLEGETGARSLAAESVVTPEVTTPLPAAPVAGASLSPIQAALALSVAITLVLVARVLLSHRRLHRLAAPSPVTAAVDANWIRLVQDTRANLQIVRPVQVRITECGTGPGHRRHPPSCAAPARRRE